jgi:hypothetical protein
LITTVHDRLHIEFNSRLAILMAVFTLAGLFSLGAGMMTVVVSVTPAMIKTNAALGSCMDFERRIRSGLEGRITGTQMEIHNLEAVNLQLIRQIADTAVRTPQPNKQHVPAPKLSVGGEDESYGAVSR